MGEFAVRDASRAQPTGCGRDRGRTNRCVGATKSMVAYCTYHRGDASNRRLLSASPSHGHALATVGGVCCRYGVAFRWYGGAGKGVTADRADYERQCHERSRFGPPSFFLSRAEGKRLCHCCAASWKVVVVVGSKSVAGAGSSTDKEKVREKIGRSYV